MEVIYQLNDDVRDTVRAYNLILEQEEYMKRLTRKVNKLYGVGNEAPTWKKNVRKDKKGQGKKTLKKIGKLLVKLEAMQVARQKFGMKLENFKVYALYHAYLFVCYGDMLHNLQSEFSVWAEKMDSECKLMKGTLDGATKMAQLLTESKPSKQEEGEDKDEHEEMEEEMEQNEEGEEEMEQDEEGEEEMEDEEDDEEDDSSQFSSESEEDDKEEDSDD
ncbi:unnamed protein product [Orchesella dallaii]|uniref:Uncharacterized protein n=1 Tax=Orchesella dallaii TaxID=48710 RepID=A0ABP1RYT9_9HEXA